MPFTHSVTYYPATGKALEFRSLAVERVRSLQASGIAANYTIVAWGPDYPSARIGMRFATLADHEKHRTEGLEATRAFAASIAPLLRQPAMTTLSEALQQTNQSLPAKWGHWAVCAPAMGKGPEVRALMLERGKDFDAQGRRTTLSVQVAGPESGVFTRIFSYASLADYEEQRARNVADETQQAYMRKLNALLSRPMDTSIREVIIPFPQA